jgi:hypothetical protein
LRPLKLIRENDKATRGSKTQLYQVVLGRVTGRGRSLRAEVCLETAEQGHYSEEKEGKRTPQKKGRPDC